MGEAVKEIHPVDEFPGDHFAGSEMGKP